MKAQWKAIKTPIIHCREFLKKTPYQIKSIAVKDCCKAVSNAKLKFKKEGGYNEVKFKSRKNPSQSCYIPKQAVGELGVYHTLAGKLRMSEHLPQNHSDARLLKENDRYFLVVSYEDQKERAPDNQGRIVALDPGVRSFLAWYSEDDCGKIGEGAFRRIEKLCFAADGIISEMSKVKCAAKLRKRKALRRIKWKIQNLLEELHWKSARFLCDHYDVILMPSFDVSEMVVKSARKIRSKTVRAMLGLQHYKFSQRLDHMANKTGKTVVEVNEAYTSKTASWSGEIIGNLGGKKTIKSASISMDRDYNGSRGIFLRSLVDSPSLFVFNDDLREFAPPL